MALAMVLALGWVSLAGCAGAGSPFSGNRTEADQFPPGAPTLDVDTTTSRYQGEADGYRVYLARPSDGSGVCIVAIRLPHDSAAACTASGKGFALGTGDGTQFRYHSDVFSQGDTGHRLSRYVDIVPAPTP
jgi:hypothetical protein